MRLSLGEGRVPRSAAFWRWKHLENPFGASPVLLAEEGGELVGLRVFLRWEWRFRGEAVRAVRAVDTATHPEWRGRGIFSRLTLELADRMREEGMAFVFNTPNRSSRPGYLKMGWRSLGRGNLRVRPARLLPGRGIGSEEAAVGEVADFLTELSERPPVRWRGDGAARLHTAPTPAYLAWRYRDLPGFRYGAMWSLEQGAEAALICHERMRGRFRELRLCEVLVGASRGSERRARELLRSVGPQAGPGFVTAMAGVHAAGIRILPAAGFLPVPRAGPVFTVRPLATEGSPVDPLRRASWGASIGDLELF